MTGWAAGGYTAGSSKPELINCCETSLLAQAVFPNRGGSGSLVKEGAGNNMGAADHL